MQPLRFCASDSPGRRRLPAKSGAQVGRAIFAARHDHMRILPPHRFLAIGGLAIAAAIAPAVRAECAPELRYGSESTFFGKQADGRKLGATLAWGVPEGQQVAGRVFREPKYADVPIQGLFDPPSNVVLSSALDGTVVFRGTFVDGDRDSAGGAHCDVLAGATGDGIAAVLKLHSGRHGSSPRMNEVALAVHDAILAGDAARLADYVRFPFQAWGPGGRKPIIHDRAQFVRAYAQIVSPALKAQVQADIPHDLSCRTDGCWMGHGFIWFDPDARVTGFASRW